LTKLDKIMKEKKITNIGLARQTGLHVKTIRELRKLGCENARYSTLRKLCDVLKVKGYEL
jgi:DNA-binding Xre family transcriptional regulator